MNNVLGSNTEVINSNLIYVNYNDDIKIKWHNILDLLIRLDQLISFHKFYALG